MIVPGRRMAMKRWLTVLLIAALVLIGAAAMGEDYQVAEGNAESFGTLLVDMLCAYEQPSPLDDRILDVDVEVIRAVSEEDGELARAIADHWRAVYLDREYRLCVDQGDGRATSLEESDLQDSADHAFVVLGYELKDGKMTRELMGRCEAAASAARSFPSAILVCSGGATGRNNPQKYTEAGLMKAYLVQRCGIDAGRIFIDEQAMTTVENAIHTFEILRAQGVRTITVVTSTYHQRWGQVIYNAMAAIYRLRYGYDVDIVGNYCFQIEPSHDSYRRDDRIAVRQLTSVLNLPKETVERMQDDLRRAG